MRQREGANEEHGSKSHPLLLRGVSASELGLEPQREMKQQRQQEQIRHSQQKCPRFVCNRQRYATSNSWTSRLSSSRGQSSSTTPWSSATHSSKFWQEGQARGPQEEQDSNSTALHAKTWTTEHWKPTPARQATGGLISLRVMSIIRFHSLLIIAITDSVTCTMTEFPNGNKKTWTKKGGGS